MAVALVVLHVCGDGSVVIFIIIIVVFVVVIVVIVVARPRRLILRHCPHYVTCARAEGGYYQN